MSATILTLSFRGDLEPCRLLCRSVDELVDPGFEHILAVPRSDLTLFAPLARPGRRLVAQEELLPPWLRKLPLPPPDWRARLGLTRRNVYVSPRTGLVRGWIAQQLMKIAGAAAVDTEVVLHADSDVAFVRPLDRARLGGPGRTPLVRVAGADDDAMHRPWHRTASELLGLAPADYHGADYIDTVIVWRADVARALLARIAEVSGGDALAALARCRDLSEYILYGVFCDEVLGIEASGHVVAPARLCATVWSEAEWTDRSRPPVPPVEPHHLCACIQSTVPASPEQRAEAFSLARARAAAQDEEAGPRAASA